MNFLPGLPLRVADFDLQASESAVLAPQSLQARPFKLKSQEACLPQCLGYPGPTNLGHRTFTDIGNHSGAEQQHRKAQSK
jgi:hypothetical protein